MSLTRVQISTAAIELGAQASTIAGWERGERTIPRSWAAKLADHFDVKVAALDWAWNKS